MTGPSQLTAQGQDRSILTVCVLSASGEGLEDIDVVAYPTSTPGLVVHRSPWDSTTWTVTHVRTGTGLSQLSWPSRHTAALLAQRLGPLADWTADEQQLCASAGGDVNGFRGRIRQTAEELASELGLSARHDGPLPVVDQVPFDQLQGQWADHQLQGDWVDDLDAGELLTLTNDVRAILDQLIQQAAARGLKPDPGGTAPPRTGESAP